MLSASRGMSRFRMEPPSPAGGAPLEKNMAGHGKKYGALV